jgi:hypothetical protein
VATPPRVEGLRILCISKRKLEAYEYSNTSQMSEPVLIFQFSIEAMKFVFYFHSKCVPGGSGDTYDEAVPMIVLASKQ